ncbi:hypothetical protein J3459_011893 [Metarhizium acridum]|nr:hypothetical protein J3459_011893 [Metarhizium acridum]
MAGLESHHHRPAKAQKETGRSQVMINRSDAASVTNRQRHLLAPSWCSGLAYAVVLHFSRPFSPLPSLATWASFFTSLDHNPHVQGRSKVRQLHFEYIPRKHR